MSPSISHVRAAGHGGCGELQPKIRKEMGTFKLWAEFKQTNVDERSSERKELITAQQVTSSDGAPTLCSQSLRSPPNLK